MKRLLSLIFIIVSNLLILSAQETKLPDIIETPVGNFVKEWEGSYTCVVEKDGQEIDLRTFFESNISQQKLDQRLLILQDFFLQLPELEKKVFSYAAKKAAGGKYKRQLSKSKMHIVSIWIDDSDKIEFVLVTDESVIHGCDLICVICNLDGSFENVYLVG